MTIFNLVFFKILTSLLSVFLGYLSGKYGAVTKHSLASLIFYFIAPIIFFAIPTSSNGLQFSDMSISLVSFCLCCILSFSTYYLYGFIWDDSHKNILALSAGTGNSTFVMLPIVTALFDEKTLSIYALGLMGVAIYEMSIGCYFCARSISSFKESVIKIMKLPMLNAFILGVCFSLAGFRLPDFLDDFIINMKSSFFVLGMILIGVAVSRIEKLTLDFKFIGFAFLGKFVLFPLVFTIFVLIDKYLLGLYNQDYYNVLIMLSIAPMATNVIVLSSLYDIFPEKVATTVLLSIIFSLVYIPIITTLLLSYL